MIDALFSQPNYLVAKKALDAVELRHEAIATNIANLETPGYKRVDIAPSFNDELARACASRDLQQISSLSPSVVIDPNGPVAGPDGNNVNLEAELIKMGQNSLAHAMETQLVGGSLIRLKMAIAGKSG